MGDKNNFTESVLEVFKGQNADFWKQMQEDNLKMKQKEEEAKIKEIEENIPDIDRDLIREVLVAKGWDVPEAIFHFIQSRESKQDEERKKKREEEAKKKREKEAKTLQEMFGTIPFEQIAKTLDDNEGDVDATITQLIALVEEKQKPRREEEKREITINEFFEKFSENITRDEVANVFKQAGFDVQKTACELLKISERRKIQRLQLVFKDFNEVTIEGALKSNGWVLKDAMKALLAENFRLQSLRQAEEKRKQEEEMREKLRKEEEERIRKEEEKIRETRRREQEEEKKRREEEERRRKELAELKNMAEHLNEEKRKKELERQEEELRKQAEERKREEKRKEEEAKAMEAEKKALEERKRKIEEERKREEEERRRRVEEEERLRKLEEEKRQSEEAARKQQQQQDLLYRSEYITKDVLEKIDKEVEKARLVAREHLEQHLRGGQEGLPGFQPQNQTSQPQQQPSPVHSPESIQEAKKEAPFVAGQPTTETEGALASVGLKLSAGPEDVEGGASITVEWDTLSTSSFQPSNSDWIAMYMDGADFKTYETWEWVNGAKKGSIQFKAPHKNGKLHFCYFAQKSFVLCSTSNSINLGPRYSLSTSRPTKAGDITKVDLYVKQTSGSDYPKAWVGLYEKKVSGLKDPNYYSWKWLSSGAYSPEGRSLTFEVPKAGQWEFRLFVDRLPYFGEEPKSLAVATTSLLVEGNDSLVLSVQDDLNQITILYDITSVDPKVENVWIGVFHVGQIDNRQYRRYKYVPQNKGSMTFKKLQHAGSYEARLFANKSFDSVIFKSNSIQISDPK